MGAKHEYDLVQGTDETKDDPQPIIIRQSVFPWWKFVLCNLLAVGAGAAAMYLVLHDASATQSPSSAVANIATSAASAGSLSIPTSAVEHIDEDVKSQDSLVGKILDCGYSPEEARAKGCVYDVMMQDWVPEPCYDSVLTERYLAKGNYTWYADGDGLTTLSDEQMRKGEHGGAWMSTSYHKDHCVFSWTKIIRALRNNWGISQELLSYDHVLHCSHGALKEDSNDQGLGVRAPTNYAKCALYETWRHNWIPDKHNATQ